MLEKIPAAVGQALSGFRAGIEKTVHHAEFAAAPQTIALTSPAFADGAELPPRFTADGEGTSPPLAWSGLPEGTASLVILVEDSGSPTPRPLVHLIVWNLMPDVSDLAEGAATSDAPVALGRNSFLKDGWLPPDPPTGHGAHGYLFQVYALDRVLELAASPGRGALVDAMRGHVLAKGSLMGTYERR